MPKQKDLAALIKTAQEWTLYLDEAWFIPHDGAIQRNEGVIAGILCKGRIQENASGLTALRTHSYEQPLKARNALQELS